MMIGLSVPFTDDQVTVEDGEAYVVNSRPGQL
jgi:hypothetical protein